MGKKRLLTLLCVCVIAASLALVSCSSNGTSGTSSTAQQTDDSTNYTLVNEGKLTIAASLDFPPFENLQGTTPVGFTVELMGLLCDELGLEVNYLPSTKFDTIIPMISGGGRADVGVSSFTITEERKLEVDFTDPYIDSNQAITVMKTSDVTNATQLAGKRIGAQSGTTGYDWAVENIPGAEVTPFDEMTAVFLALQSGQIDAVSVDLPVALYYVKSAYSDAHVVQEIPTGEQYGIAVNKDNPQLTEALNKALAAVKANGKFDTLYQKWFG